MSLQYGNQTILGNLTVSGNVSTLTNQVSTDGFGDLRITQKHNMLDLKSTFGISTLRDMISGTVTNPVGNPEYKIEVTGSNQTSVLQTYHRGKYIAGLSAEMGIGVRIPNTFIGDQSAQFGYFDTSNGFFYKYSSNTMSCCVLRNGTIVSEIPQSSWNVDPMDGTGPSQLILTPSRGNIYQVVYSWYGYGAANFRIVSTDSNGNQKVQVVHRFAPSNQTSVANPNLPIRAVVSSGITNTSNAIYVGGRQYSILGNPVNINKRTTCPYRLNASINKASGFVPLIALQRKPAYVGHPIKITSLDFSLSGDCVVQLRVNATLTGASFGNIPDTIQTETALQMDTSASAVTGGTVVFTGLAPAGSKTLISLGEIDYSLEEDQILVLKHTL